MWCKPISISIFDVIDLQKSNMPHICSDFYSHITISDSWRNHLLYAGAGTDGVYSPPPTNKDTGARFETAGLCKPSTSDTESQTERNEPWSVSCFLLLLLALCFSLSLMYIALIRKNNAVSAMEQKSLDNTYKWFGDQMEMKTQYEIRLTNLTNQVSHHVLKVKSMHDLYLKCVEENNKMRHWEKLVAKYARENSKCLAERNELQTLVGTFLFWKWPIIISSTVIATIFICLYIAYSETVRDINAMKMLIEICRRSKLPVQEDGCDYNCQPTVETLGFK